MVTALRIVEKVCLYLGRESFKDETIADSFVINSTNVIDIYGRNIPIANIVIDETFSISHSADENNISISGNAALSLAGNQTSLKVCGYTTSLMSVTVDGWQTFETFSLPEKCLKNLACL